MKKYKFPRLALILALFHVSACASTTAVQPMGVHKGTNVNEIRIAENDIYRVTFTDGTEYDVLGNAMSLRENTLFIYSSNEGKWKSYPLSSVQEVSLVKTDYIKRKRNKTLITGAAVLAAFVAAATGGYFLEKKLR